MSSAPAVAASPAAVDAASASPANSGVDVIRSSAPDTVVMGVAIKDPSDAADATAAAAGGPKDDGFKLHGWAFGLTLFALCLSVFIAGLDGTIVVVAMPQIAIDFDALSVISWVFLAFLLTQTAGTPLWGRIADIFGRRNGMLVAILLFVAGSIACALSTSFPMLACFRAVQGMGGGGLMAVSLTLLADITPADQRGAYLAPLNSMFALASVVGPILGGYITDGPGWRYCFWINVPIGAVCMLIIALNVPHTIGRTHMIVTRDAAIDAAATASSHPELDVGTVDWAGIVCVIVAVTCLCLAVTWGGSTYDWNSGIIIALFCVAGVVGSTLVYVEGWVARDPVIPMRLFKAWNFSICVIIGFMGGFAMFGSYVYLPLFFETAKGDTASQAGTSMIPMMLAMPIGAMLSGVGLTVLKRLDYKVYPLVGFTGTAISSGLYTLMTPDSPSYVLIGNLILGGLSGGLALMVPMLVSQNSVPVSDVSTATSTMQFMQSIAGLLAIAIMQSYFNQSVATLVPTAEAEFLNPAISVAQATYDVTAAYAKAVTSVFYISIAGALVGFVASCFLRFEPLSTQVTEATSAAAKAPAAAGSAVTSPVAAEAPVAAAAASSPAASAVTVEMTTMRGGAEVQAKPALTPVMPKVDSSGEIAANPVLCEP